MPAPVIKIYRLPKGYTQGTDDDVRFRAADELVPVVPKLTLLTQVKDDASCPPLTGIVPVSKQDLLCFAYNGGTKTSHALVAAAKPGYFTVAGGWASILWQPVGVLAPVVKTAGNAVIPVTGYTMTADGITFTGASVGATIEAFSRAAIGASNTFALLGDTFYRGANAQWNRFLLSKDGAEYAVTTMPADAAGYVTVTGVATSLKGTYAFKKSTSTCFLSEHPNWVGGHMLLWPDVFVGTYDYPGDQYTDGGGNVVNPGVMPLIRDIGTYSINYRDGWVEFPAAVDSTATPIKANYAYVPGVANVTNQVLDVVAGSSNKNFTANTETLFPDSHNKRWVGRDDANMPVNVYVNDVLTPQPVSVTPYETLTVKTG